MGVELEAWCFAFGLDGLPLFGVEMRGDRSSYCLCEEEQKMRRRVSESGEEDMGERGSSLGLTFYYLP